MTSPEAALAVCRICNDASATLLWGAFGYLAALVPHGLAATVGQRLSAFRVAAVAAAVVSTAAMLPIETAAIADGWRAALDPTTVGTVLFETSVGTALMARIALGGLLALSLVAPPPRRIAATAVGSGLLLASLCLTGHAVMDSGALRVAHEMNDAVHVLAGGAWLGALVPLVAILGTLDDPRRRGSAVLALRRFSTGGHVAVALVLASGAANAALILGRWPLDWASPYQRLLAIKIVAVALMVGLALVNRYALVPRLRSGRESLVAALRLATIAEIVLGAVAIGCVGVFGLLEPA